MLGNSYNAELVESLEDGVPENSGDGSSCLQNVKMRFISRGPRIPHEYIVLSRRKMSEIMVSANFSGKYLYNIPRKVYACTYFPRYVIQIFP